MAGRWRRLPEGLSAAERELVEALRGMKDRSGLSLVELAERTHHSKSSWQRWFNGERVVTEQALRRLAEVSGTDVESVLPVFRAVVPGNAEAGGGEIEGEAEGGGDLGGAAVGGSPRRRQLRYAAVGLTVIVVLAAVVVAVLWSGRPSKRAEASAAPTTATATGTTAGGCLGISCTGLDPQASGCGADAVTLTTANIQRVTIQIRYSAHCRAAWAKLTDATPGDSASITTARGGHQTALVHWGYDAYSPMVDASASDSGLQVCGEQPAGRGCTQVITDPASAPVAPSLLSPPPTGPATATPAGPER
ncbi:DUF2690 domain-containing protein [Kitasatospora sp. NPDC053057]|uniref:DUF2690 domain-containing protein n=1 Tax=Kitasatospora sp. NPDC053057 TaxID=3364062 RepID=UPI0037C554CD